MCAHIFILVTLLISVWLYYRILLSFIKLPPCTDTDMSKDKVSWLLHPKLPAALVIATALQLFGGVWAVSGAYGNIWSKFEATDTEISRIKERIAGSYTKDQAKADRKIIKIQIDYNKESITTVRNSLEKAVEKLDQYLLRIDRKLDTLSEK